MRYNVSVYARSALFEDGYIGTVCVEAVDTDDAIDQAHTQVNGLDYGYKVEIAKDQTQPVDTD